MPIYDRLFCYRPRPNRKPLEDFLSEALVDLLNRLPITQQLQFVFAVLFESNPVVIKLWQTYLKDHCPKSLQWLTQHNIGKGIIDIILKIDGFPKLVIENKIASGFHKHLDQDVHNEDVADKTQLHTYGNWLSKSAANIKLPEALVILSHFTKPPADFQTDDYGVQLTAFCRWNSVWKWAKHISKPGSASWKSETFLFLEFSQFLQNQKMDSDFATMQDFAVAQLYTQSNNRMNHTFELVAERRSDFRRTVGGNTSKIYEMTFDSNGPVVWAFIYFKSPKIKDNWYVAWGIAFPNEKTNWWSNSIPKLPDVPYAFVAASSEYDPLMPLEKLKKIPDGWSRCDEGDQKALIIGKPCHEFVQNGEQWALQFADFVQKEASSIRGVVLGLADVL